MYYKETKLGQFSSNFIFRIPSFLLGGHLSSDQQPKILTIKILLCYFFYYKNLFCFPCFSKCLLESRQSFQQNVCKGNWTQTKMKGQTVSQITEVSITQGLSSNSSYTQVLWPWTSYSISLQALYFSITQWYLHIWHVKSPKYPSPARKRKTKQNKKTSGQVKQLSR